MYNQLACLCAQSDAAWHRKKISRQVALRGQKDGGGGQFWETIMREGLVSGRESYIAKK